MILVALMPAFYRGILLAQAAAFIVHIGILQGVRWIVRKIRR
jgi:hypothetical protein